MRVFSSEFCFRAGLSGSIIFAIVFGIGALSAWKANNIWTKRIFALLSFSSLLDLPLYMYMAIYRNYAGSIVYCFHLMGDVFYFGGFSMVGQYCRVYIVTPVHVTGPNTYILMEF